MIVKSTHPQMDPDARFATVGAPFMVGTTQMHMLVPVDSNGNAYDVPSAALITAPAVHFEKVRD